MINGTRAAANTVSVVIPTFNMAWCLERAIASCRAQTHPPVEIIVVDDGSTDDTRKVVAHLVADDSRVRYDYRPSNSGHLATLRHGLQASSADWIALLDADDELLPDSLERRLGAARAYHDSTGAWPQLVYGDLYSEQVAPAALVAFTRIQGRDYPFLTRELSLCQTSTIMLGRGAVAHFPEATNPYNTDDEIVLAVAKRFPIVHSGVAVAVTHAHAGASRMTNDARRRFQGLAQLVHDHREDIIGQHGRGRLWLWRLRILRVFLEWQQERARQALAAEQGSALRRMMAGPVRGYAWLIRRAHQRLTSFLQKRFEHIYF